MPTIVGTTAVTLSDLRRRLDPDDKVAMVIDVIAETNEVMDDMLWVEGNLLTGNVTTLLTGIPAATWRKLNYGTQPTKATTKQVTDTCGMLTGLSKIDRKLVELNGNTAAFRLSEDKPHIIGLTETLVDTLFYGDTTLYPERFMGLSPRYDTYQTTDRTLSTFNVITAGGSGNGDQTSIWLVGWGANTIHGIYPKGSKAGVMQEDKGIETAYDAASGEYDAYKTTYEWDCGLAVRDWRYAVRICNIDYTNLVTDSSAADLVKFMIKAIHKIPNLKLCRPAFYANPEVLAMLDIQTLAKTNLALSYREVYGSTEVALTCRGIPVRRCDALLATEDAVAAAS